MEDFNMKYLGNIILVIFFILLLQMIKKGPFIFSKGKNYYVKIQNHEFDTEVLTVEIGDRVVWRNMDQIRHTVSTTSQTIDDSDLLFQYQDFDIIFDKPGTYTFKSSLYKNMNEITINVLEPKKGEEYYNTIIMNIVQIIKTLFENIKFLIKYYITGF